MLIELKRCNSIGNIDGLLFLVSMLSGRKRVSLNEVVNRCSLEKKIRIHCSGAIAFLQYLGYVEIEDGLVIITENFNSLLKDNKEEIINTLIKESISRITEEGLFDSDSTSFEVDKGYLSIKKSAFPLAYAAIRNFLTTVGVLEKETDGKIGISDAFESEFSAKIRKRKEKFTLAQLIQKQAEQSQRGLEAEEFVLKLEKDRVPGKAHKIKRISDFDVSAGYDIVSFDTNDSVIHNRFIEVKCYIGKLHFYWSENEVDVAKRKGDKYILCLVDYTRIEEPRYQPEFIVNPYEKIFKDDIWLVNTSSYKVQKI